MILSLGHPQARQARMEAITFSTLWVPGTRIIPAGYRSRSSPFSRRMISLPLGHIPSETSAFELKKRAFDLNRRARGFDQGSSAFRTARSPGPWFSKIRSFASR